MAGNKDTCALVVSATACALDMEGVIVDLHRVQEEASRDDSYKLLPVCMATGDWADQKEDKPPALHPYYKIRSHLSCQGDIILYAKEGHLQVVIPAALQHAVLANLHTSHQGRDSMLGKLYTGYDSEVEQKQQQCQICKTITPSQAPLAHANFRIPLSAGSGQLISTEWGKSTLPTQTD